MAIHFKHFKLLIILTTVVLHGCAYTVDPYVDPAKLTNTTSAGVQSAQCPNTVSNMATAKACTHAIQSAYIEAMGGQATLSALTGLTLIPIVAHAANLSISQKHPTNARDFTIAGSGLYAMSNWLAQPQRSQIYATGLVAIQCALDVTSDFEIAGEDLIAFREQLTNLNADKNAVLSAYSDVEGTIATIEDKEDAQVKYAMATLQKIKASIASAEQLEKSGWTLHGQFERAPKRLDNAVRKINANINLALTSTIQSLTSLPGVISGMADTYKQLQGVGGAMMLEVGDKPQNEIQQQETAKSRALTQLNTHMSTLLAKYGELKRSFSALESGLKRHTPEPATKSLTECGVDSSQLVKPLVASPTTLSFIKGNALSQKVVLSGGSGTYVFATDHNLFDVQQYPTFGHLLTIKVKDENFSGSSFISIRDISGATIVIEVLVTEAPKPAEVTSKPVPDTVKAPEEQTCSYEKLRQQPPFTPAERVFCTSGKSNITQLQTALDSGKFADGKADFVDGTYGQRTYEAIKRFLAKYPKVDQALNEATFSALSHYVEQSYSSEEEIKSALTWIKSQLNLAAEHNDHDSVLQYQTQNNLTQTGFVDTATMKKICQSNDTLCQ